MVAGCVVVPLDPGWRVRCGVYLLGPFGTFRSGPSVPSARALRYLPLGPFGTFRSGCAWWQPIPHGSSKMSHVIPLRVFQTLKSCRWDCNVCGVSRKMTKLNYVRLWGRGVGAWGLSARALRYLPLGPFGAFCSGCAWWQPLPHGSSKMSHVIPLRVFQTLKSCRWDCNVCGVSRKMTKLNYVQLLGGARLGRSWAWGWGAAGRGVGAQLGAGLGRGGLRASSAARCRRVFRRRRSTGACAR